MSAVSCADQRLAARATSNRFRSFTCEQKHHARRQTLAALLGAIGRAPEAPQLARLAVERGP